MFSYKDSQKLLSLACNVLPALACVPGLSQTARKMKMTTDIPADPATPDEVNSHLVEVKFLRRTSLLYVANAKTPDEVSAFLRKIGSKGGKACSKKYDT
jgi:hypothetical protein